MSVLLATRKAAERSIRQPSRKARSVRSLRYPGYICRAALN
jgi:hypothetical protein